VKTSQKKTRSGPVETPPYISYKTFSGFMDRLYQRGVPNRIDRSFLAFLSGSNQSHLLAALRYLGLISPVGVRTDRLEALVKSVGAEYAPSLREVLKQSYPFLFNRFDLRRATLQEVEDKFSDAGASGDTVRKCIAFFLSAARAADIPTSPFITGIRRRRRSASLASARDPKLATGEGFSKLHDEGVGNRSIGTAGCAELLVAKFPQFDPTWPDEIKLTWFESFQKLMEKLGS
jgi:hypothetical protein